MNLFDRLLVDCFFRYSAFLMDIIIEILWKVALNIHIYNLSSRSKKVMTDS